MDKHRQNGQRKVHWCCDRFSARLCWNANKYLTIFCLYCRREATTSKLCSSVWTSRHDRGTPTADSYSFASIRSPQNPPPPLYWASRWTPAWVRRPSYTTTYWSLREKRANRSNRSSFHLCLNDFGNASHCELNAAHGSPTQWLFLLVANRW